MNGVHLVVFCAVDYKHLLDDCIESALENIQDEILSITVFTNAPFTTNHNIILDIDFWKKIDPSFAYINLYKHNWVKQQILKLHLDLLLSGNILVLDVEVRFNKPTQFCENDKFNIFFKTKPVLDSANFVTKVSGIEPTIGYLTETMVFASDILENLRTFVESKFANSYIDVYRNIVFDDPQSQTPLLTVFMSEYELYGNFVTKNYSDRILNHIPYSLDHFYSIEHNKQTKDSDSDTQWINFYEQIKDPSWPGCWNESDFSKLPQHIQDECINIFGYKPNE
jgi:hypothetical protein